ncbi:hypothetical protein ES731_08295 [Psychroflexus gondwanensis]|nr:hypothetical protein ES731_08295 [Psychroflexus gondwanensis]
MGLVEFSIQISLFSKAKFTCLPRNAGRLELTCIQFKLFKLTTHHYTTTPLHDSRLTTHDSPLTTHHSPPTTNSSIKI